MFLLNTSDEIVIGTSKYDLTSESEFTLSAKSDIVVTLYGITIDVIPLPKNAPSPILSKLPLFGIDTVVSEVQFLNASLPIKIVLAGIDAVVSEVQFINAFPQM